MAQPTPYNQAYDFSDYQASNPSAPLPGDRVDIELAAIELTLDETLTNLALIQRDDGALANESVGIDQLAADIDTGFASFADWATSTAYVVRDGVYEGNKVYRCIESHTSGTFSVDLAANKWAEVLDFDQFLSAAETSATNAAASEANAATSETNAAASETNAATSETNAAASAAAAASSAAEGMYNNVIELTNADSPYVPLLADEGTLYKIDTTSGTVVVNLSALSVYGEDMKYSFVRVAGGNDVTINRGGSDTFNGADTVITISDSYIPNLIVGDESSADWVKVIQQAPIDLDDLGRGIAGISELALYNSGGTSGFQTTIQTSGAATAARDLEIVMGDANRTVTLGGDITTAGDLTTTGAFALEFTITGATGVTLPTSGTLATTAELITDKTAFPLSSNPTVAVSAGTTTYAGIAVHIGSASAVDIPLPFPGTVTALYCVCSVAPSPGQQNDYTFVKNGSDTALTATISGTDTSASDTGSISVAAGDTVCVKVVTSGSAASATHRFVALIERD